MAQSRENGVVSRAMYVQPLIQCRDEHSALPDNRWQIGQCLRHAFAVGDGGSFTTLLQAIGNDTARPAEPRDGKSARE